MHNKTAYMGKNHASENNLNSVEMESKTSKIASVHKNSVKFCIHFTNSVTS